MTKEDRTKIAYAALAFILASLSVMAYIYFTRLGINYPVPKFSSLMGFTLGDCIVLGLGTWAYYKFILSKPKLKYTLLVISLILAFCAIFLGEQYRGGAAGFLGNILSAPFLYIASYIGFCAAIYACLYSLGIAVCQNINNNKIYKEINIYLFALGILAIWLIGYFILLFPGGMRWESGLVIGFIEGIFEPRRVAPAFYQLFISAFYYAGKWLGSDTVGLLLYFICVGYVSALAQARLVDRAFRLNISRYYVYAFVALCTFNPLVFMQSFIMSYDSLLAIAMLYFAIEIYDIIVNKYSKNLRLFFASFALCAFRNVGFAILIAFIIVSAVFFIKKFKKKSLVLIGSMLLSAIIFFFGNNIAFNIMNIEKKEHLSNASVALYQLGYTLHKHGSSVLTDSEKALLEPYVDIESIGNNYYQNVSDSVKYQFLYHDNPYEKNIKDGGEEAFISVWKSLAKRYPKEYISAFVKSCYKFVIPGFFEETNDWGRWQHAPMHIDGIELIESYKPLQRSESDIDYREGNALFAGYTTIYGAFMSSGYIFMIVVITALLLIRRKNNILPLLPAIIYSLGMLFSPVNGWLRYAVPAGFALPLSMLMILYSLRGESDEYNR